MRDCPISVWTHLFCPVIPLQTHSTCTDYIQIREDRQWLLMGDRPTNCCPRFKERTLAPVRCVSVVLLSPVPANISWYVCHLTSVMFVMNTWPNGGKDLIIPITYRPPFCHHSRQHRSGVMPPYPKSPLNEAKTTAQGSLLCLLYRPAVTHPNECQTDGARECVHCGLATVAARGHRTVWANRRHR